MLVQSAEEYFENQELLLLYHDDSGRPTPLFHKHDYYEITIMLSGKMDCHFENCTFQVSAGDILLIRPDEVHWKEISEDGRHFNVSVLTSSVQSALDYLTEDRDCSMLFSPEHLPPCTLSTLDFRHISQAVTMLSEDYIANSATMRFRTRSLIIDTLSAYLVMNSQPSDSGSDIPPWLNQYLESFRHRSNLIKGVAYFKDVPVSHGHLCRLFKKHLNMTITEFVNDVRLSYAAKALLQSDVPIIEINAEIGFASLSHFYRCFKAKYGVTPNEYRTLGADRRAKLFRTFCVQDT